MRVYFTVSGRYKAPCFCTARGISIFKNTWVDMKGTSELHTVQKLFIGQILKIALVATAAYESSQQEGTSVTTHSTSNYTKLHVGGYEGKPKNY